MTLEAVIAEVMRDMDYYAESGGGVTLSGGEPFMQAASLTALLQLCKERGIHTAVETTGYTALANLEATEPFVDLFLLDIKSADSEQLSAVIGAGNDGAAADSVDNNGADKGNAADNNGAADNRIFQSITWLGKHCPEKVRVRIPVIPGFNNTEAAISAIFQLAKDNAFTAVDLLPYHTLGKGKYRKLGRDYPWTDAKMLSEEDMLPFAEIGIGNRESGIGNRVFV
jgi:pyruvate formate lyase activating enzyme